jgi:hypothetical protein
MSTQWDTAKHCHRALSLLAENIRHSFTSTQQSPSLDLATTSNQHINPSSREEAAIASKRRKLSSYDPSVPLPSASASAESISGQDLLDAPVSGNVHLEPNATTPNGNFPIDDSSTSAAALMDLDLNTVDLLQGANFDYLLDMFGQQYPSF